MQGSVSTKVPKYVLETCYEYRGVLVPRIMASRCLDQLGKMKCRPDDVFIISYPKSGRNWLQLVALLISLDGDVSRLEGDHVNRLTFFLDIVADTNNPETSQTQFEWAEQAPSPRILKTHGLLDWLPEAIRTDDSEVKVIYLVRNPKDVAVSYYHFCHSYKWLPPYENWDVFFEEFVAGRGLYGSWFDHVLTWWKRKSHSNVFILKYEDMTKDLRGEVEKLAHFMGKSFSSDVIDRIVAASTFSAMKENKSANPDFHLVEKVGRERGADKPIFMRKGEVGDWKNFFTEEQNERFDELYRKEMADSGLELDFEL